MNPVGCQRSLLHWIGAGIARPGAAAKPPGGDDRGSLTRWPHDRGSDDGKPAALQSGNPTRPTSLTPAEACRYSCGFPESLALRWELGTFRARGDVRAR